MRKVSFLIALITVFLPLSLAFADGSLDWEVSIPSQYFWYDPFSEKLILSANTPLTIDITAVSSWNQDVSGYVFNLVVYGTGDLVGLIWNNSGATPIPPANEPSILFTGGGGEWQSQFMYTSSWDGVLPDSLCHSTLSFIMGFPPYMEETLIYQLYLTIPTFEFQTEYLHGELCVDRVIGHPNGDCDWLFPLPTTINTPFCQEIKTIDCGLAYSYSGPDTLFYEPGVSFAATFEYEHECKQGMIRCDLGTAYVSSAGIIRTIHWTFDSPENFCNWTGTENRVRIEPCGFWGCGLVKYVTLIYPSEPPQIKSGCGASYYVAPDIENSYLLDAEDPEEVGILNWYVSSTPEPEGEYSVSPNGYLSFTPTVNDVGGDFTFNLKAKDCGGIIGECDLNVKVRDNPFCGDFDYNGSINILDIVYLINAKFKHGPPPSPTWIADTEPDEIINILDILALVNYKFKQGPAPICQ